MLSVRESSSRYCVIIALSITILLLIGPGISIAQAPEGPLIYLQNKVFDPLASDPAVSQTTQPLASSTASPLWILQFTGPVQQEWKEQLNSTGVHLYDYIPDFAFIARIPDDALDHARALPFVRWIGLYHPSYREAAAVSQSAGHAEEMVTLAVQALPDADDNRINAQIQELGGSIDSRAQTALADYLRITIGADKISELAALDSVVWVERAPERQLLNDIGGGILRANEIRRSLGLYGQGQIVAVADIGLDTGNLNTLHKDIAGRVLGAFCLGRPSPCDWSDSHGHGTHVTGVLLGSGQSSGSDPTMHQYSGSYAGVAPEASLIMQAVGDSAGGLNGLGADVGAILTAAYNQGARIHNDSWGSPTGTSENGYGGYTLDSQQVDQALWDHPEMLALFGAGNSGADADRDGVVDPDSLYAPATAKNVLAVGSSESLRSQILTLYGTSYGAPISYDRQSNSTSGIAAFSSRGPTDDGRIKPDLVAPGTYIASMRTQEKFFHDTLENGVSDYSLGELSQGAAGDWSLTNESSHSPNHSWKETAQGTYNSGAMTTLLLPELDMRISGGTIRIQFWHKYQLASGDALAVLLHDPVSGQTYTYNLNKSQSQAEYHLETISLSISVFHPEPKFVQIGFGIKSSGVSNSIWWIDDIVVSGYHWGLLSSYGLAEPDSALDKAYAFDKGTSMATPFVAGAAALTREWLAKERGVTSPSGALVKSLLLNGAANISPGQYGAGVQREIPPEWPNNVSGWGRADLVGTLAPPYPREFWFVDHKNGLSTGASISFPITAGVPLNDGFAPYGPLQVVLAWTDYPGAASGGKALVNDLDLEITGPDGKHYYGNQTAELPEQCIRDTMWDACNNVEGVTLPHAGYGVYTATIHAYQVAQGGKQPFALSAVRDFGDSGIFPIFVPLIRQP